MPLKKIYSASKYLKILAENINDIYNERKEKFCCNTKKIIQDENQIKTNLNEKESELRNLYELCEDKCIEIDEKKKNLIFFLQNLRKIQKKEFLFVFRKEILFNSYLKILNFECKAREKMLFTLFSAKKHPSFEIKISFLNELNKIYFMKKFKPENVELKEINQIYQGEINIEKSEDYIPITNDIDETRSLMLKNAWKFRYHKCFFLKHLQFEINKIISQKSLLFIEPILNSTLMLTDKFDYAQTLDYNFQYVMPLFSEQNWQSIKNIQQNQYKNKYKIVKYFSSLMYILLCFLKNQAEKNENTGVHFLQVIIIFLFFFFYLKKNI